MLVLIRHGRVDVPTGVCYGRMDVAPVEAGFPKILRALGGVGAMTLWSSPARRCAVVAAAIGGARGVAVRWDRRLLELDFGEWEGVAWDSLSRASLDRWAAWPAGFAAPGGERGGAMMARVRCFYAGLRRRAGAQVVVSHGGPLRVLAALARGEVPDLLVAAPGLGSVQFFAEGG